MQQMALGQFVFALSTIAPQIFQRSTAWRHPSNSRIGARPASQFAGLGDETMSLDGVIVPEFGVRAMLNDLRAMADTGAAWPLVDGDGYVYGQYCIESIHETGSHLLPNGAPRRVEFQIALKRCDDARVDAIR